MRLRCGSLQGGGGGNGGDGGFSTAGVVGGAGRCLEAAAEGQRREHCQTIRPRLFAKTETPQRPVEGDEESKRRRVDEEGRAAEALGKNSEDEEEEDWRESSKRSPHGKAARGAMEFQLQKECRCQGRHSHQVPTFMTRE